MSTELEGHLGDGGRWSSLPIELRIPIIRMVCEEELGDAAETESCARLAKAGLNLVSREFWNVASPLQWQHLVLHGNKDVALFLRDIVPKYGHAARKATLHSDDDMSLPDTLRGQDEAVELLGESNAILASPTDRPTATVLAATFHRAVSASQGIQELSLSGVDWTVWLSQETSWGESVRKLDVRYTGHLHVEALRLLLRSLRTGLQELRIDTSRRRRERFASRPQGDDLFVHADLKLSKDPLLPRLQVLCGPQEIVVPALLMHPPRVSTALRQLTLTELASRPWNYASLVEKYCDSLDTFTVDDHGLGRWGWWDLRMWSAVLQPAREACKRHGIHFSWIIVLGDRRVGEQEECPADLVGFVDLV